MEKFVYISTKDKMNSEEGEDGEDYVTHEQKSQIYHNPNPNFYWILRFKLSTSVLIL